MHSQLFQRIAVMLQGLALGAVVVVLRVVDVARQPPSLGLFMPCGAYPLVSHADLTPVASALAGLATLRAAAYFLDMRPNLRRQLLPPLGLALWLAVCAVAQVAIQVAVRGDAFLGGVRGRLACLLLGPAVAWGITAGCLLTLVRGARAHESWRVAWRHAWREWRLLPVIALVSCVRFALVSTEPCRAAICRLYAFGCRPAVLPDHAGTWAALAVLEALQVLAVAYGITRNSASWPHLPLAPLPKGPGCHD